MELLDVPSLLLMLQLLPLFFLHPLFFLLLYNPFIFVFKDLIGFTVPIPCSGGAGCLLVDQFSIIVKQIIYRPIP